MAIDITTSGNYIIFTSDDFTPNREQRYPKKEVRYGRSDVNDQTYVFYHNNNSINNLNRSRYGVNLQMIRCGFCKSGRF